ncbi:MAG: PSP1 domain-containing protein [Bacteroidetes bacterium OLB11]|nr:MAG: PSP1 domain-containing protein [Bacteroidetes bacterium OLB11]
MNKKYLNIKMGCSSCEIGGSGTKPKGCKSNGNCGTSGCNRMNTYDWLSMIPVAEFSIPFPYIEVSFNHGSRKDYFYCSNPLQYEKGEFITVESTVGYDIGVVSLTGELVKLQMKKKGVKENNTDIKKVLHTSTEDEIQRFYDSKKIEKEMLIESRVIARQLNLEMKIAEVEVQADNKKATFFYTAIDRVDFRELIRKYAERFKLKIEMRQIGIRQEAAKVGGIGTCGRELCCSTWINDFKAVNTSAARYQNLSINQTKLSGQCGRLKCCLNYELDTYLDALKVFPTNADRIKTKAGTAYLQKKDIFKNLMWYSFEKSNTLYPLTIERVKEIVELNKQSILPEELQAVEVSKKQNIADKTDFVDVVGQFSLKGLERASKKKKNAAKAKGTNPTQAANSTQPKPQNRNKDNHKKNHHQKGKNAPSSDNSTDKKSTPKKG